MALKAGWPATVITVLGIFAYPLLLHVFVVKNAAGWLGISLALLPVAGLVLWCVKQSRHPLIASAIILLIGLGVWAAWSARLIDITAAYYLPHVLFNLALMVLFGHTLLPGHEPLITLLARRVHGTIPPQIVIYTAQVTWLWTIFFAATVLLSLLLYRFAPLPVWSVFANVLSLPLVILLFVGEYVFRLYHIRDFAHVSILKGVQAMIDHTQDKSEAK
ncbi:MAG: hypothetical protein ABIW48_06490 [Burkholderiales bacterium]